MIDTGIYTNISHAEYHSMTDRVSNSYLSRLDVVPALAKLPQKETDALKIGRAFHCLVLEGKTVFDAEFAIAPEILNLRTNSGKALWQEFQNENDDKAIIFKDEFDTIAEMYDAIFHHPFACKLLGQGRSEVTVLWTDEKTGIQCKCRPDKVPDGNKGVIVDLKSVADASEKAFTNAVIKYGWFREAGIYIEGWNAVCNGKVDAFLFLACEKEPPYRVEVYVLDDDFLDYGKAEFHRLLNIEKKCREDNFYPHYKNEGTSEITMPKWMDWGDSNG